MKFKKNEKVYVNFNDGVMQVEILHVHIDGYKINVSGRNFIMGFKEVSKTPSRIKGVPAIRTPSYTEDP